MILAALIAITFAAVAIIAAVAFCVDAKDKRTRAEDERNEAYDTATRATNMAESWQVGWQQERDAHLRTQARYESLARAHRNCPTHVKPHMRVTRKSDEAWFDELYGDSHPAHERKADERP